MWNLPITVLSHLLAKDLEEDLPEDVTSSQSGYTFRRQRIRGYFYNKMRYTNLRFTLLCLTLLPKTGVFKKSFPDIII